MVPYFKGYLQQTSSKEDMVVIWRFDSTIWGIYHISRNYLLKLINIRFFIWRLRQKQKSLQHVSLNFEFPEVERFKGSLAVGCNISAKKCWVSSIYIYIHVQLKKKIYNNTSNNSIHKREHIKFSQQKVLYYFLTKSSFVLYIEIQIVEETYFSSLLFDSLCVWGIESWLSL